MGEAEQQILQMLSDGVISAAEASQLLRALREDADPSNNTNNEVDPTGRIFEGDILSSTGDQPPPELSRYRRFWLIPFLIAAGSAVLSAAGLFFLYQAEDSAVLGFLCLWPILILALLAAVVLVLAQRSTWLYLNVEERSGTRIRLVFPLPLGFVNWAVRAARPFVPSAQLFHLETAASMVRVMKDNPDREPIIINVDDDSGDRVQIYIG